MHAARILRDCAPTLITAVESSAAGQLAELARNWPSAPLNLGRDSAVAFDYLTPVSTPTITGLQARLAQAVDVDHDDVLAYGMIEHAPSRKIRARRAVIDSQSPEALATLSSPKWTPSELSCRRTLAKSPHWLAVFPMSLSQLPPSAREWITKPSSCAAELEVFS